MSIAWVPGGDGAFVVAHADGNLYVYEKGSLQLEKKYILSSSIKFQRSSCIKRSYLFNYASFPLEQGWCW
jgi:hypothetical protein